MRYWLRELIGWLLMLVGLVLFYLVVYLLLHYEKPRFIEAGLLTSVGFIIFRGGIHLLKVAAAAQVCREYQATLAETTTPTPARRTDDKVAK